jgi:hypothetical protein
MTETAMSPTAGDVLPRMTRRQGVAFLQREGIPITLSTFNKLAAQGLGPPVDEYWGKIELRTPKTWLQWGLGRLRPGKTKAAA